MKPWIHAKSSVRKWGGKPEDYLPIHDMMDDSKSSVADVRHRVVFHHAYGIFVMEKIFGTVVLNSDGKEVSVRDIAEQHVIEDLGFIPTLEYWTKNVPIQGWMNRQHKVGKTMVIPLED